MWDVLAVSELDSTDRLPLYKQIGEYCRQLQEKNPYLANLNPWDFLFEDKNGEFTDLVLNSPDILTNEDKLTEKSAKAYAILSLLFNVAQLELAKVSSQFAESVNQAIQTLLKSYNDTETLEIVRSFIRRGRMSFAGTPPVGISETQKKSRLGKLDALVRKGFMKWASVHPSASFRITEENNLSIRQLLDTELTLYLNEKS